MLGLGLRLGLKARIFGLGLAVPGLGLGLAPCGLVNIGGVYRSHFSLENSWQIAVMKRPGLLMQRDLMGLSIEFRTIHFRDHFCGYYSIQIDCFFLLSGLFVAETISAISTSNNVLCRRFSL